MGLKGVMTVSEAAKKWGFYDSSAIRKKINKFNEDEVFLSEGTWLITEEAMNRMFGPQPSNQKLQ